MQGDVERLVDDIREALNVLGEGPCLACQCDGCQWERLEAMSVLNIALARQERRLCPECEGKRYIYKGSRLDFDSRDLDLCPECQGSGVKKTP